MKLKIDYSMHNNDRTRKQVLREVEKISKRNRNIVKNMVKIK